jgi:hypothetical protein
MHRRTMSPLALLLPLAVAGCIDTDEGPEQNYGVIGLTTIATETDTILSPEALFYRSGQLILPSSRVGGDECQVAPYPPVSGEIPVPRFVDAGDSVRISTADRLSFLFPTIEDNREVYALKQGERFSFHPGEEVTVTVPGAPGGFANGTISVLTARPFTLGPIPAAPPANEGLPLTWTPAGDDSTKMLVSIQYGVGQPTANQQIFCSLRDDGSATIPEVLISQYRSATTGSRFVEAARWRVSLRQVEGGVLVLVSAYEVEEFVD